MSDEFEAGIFQEGKNVFPTPGEKIVEAKNFMTFRNESLTKVRTNKPRSARDQYAHLFRPHQSAALSPSY
jgi:hypothetical protein